MVALGKDDLANTKNAIRHAMEYSETSKSVIQLLLNHIEKHYGKKVLLDVIEELNVKKD